MLLGLVGTIISMIGLSFLLITLNDLVYGEDDPNKLSQSESLLLAAVLCATDTVAALSIVRESQFPTLNSILFGEGVVNDAVAILIYKAVEGMIDANDDSASVEEIEITIGIVFETAVNFLLVAVVSVLIGLIIGLISALISKKFPSFKEHPVMELFLIVLLGYLSYIIVEAIAYSAIMSLFTCGVTMSHYTFHNISAKAREGSVLAINTLGHSTEAFLFIYLGLSLFTIDQTSFYLPMIVYIIIGSAIARAFAVFIPLGLYILINRCRGKKVTLSFKQMLIIWFSGLIRGAIAFALSEQINSSLSPHRDQMVTTTLMVVLITTIVFGGLMAVFAKLIGLKSENSKE